MPANRSSLTSDSCKIVGCKNSRDIHKEASNVKTSPSQVIGLADGSQLDKQIKDIPVAPSAKKRRFVGGEYDLMQHIGSSLDHTLGNKIFFSGRSGFQY